MNVISISPQALRDAASKDSLIELIDVRTPAEFREVHLDFARNVPLDKIDPEQIAADRRGPEIPLYVICRSGSRSKQACEKLLRAGHTKVVSVDGGTAAWEDAGLSVVRGKKVMSLERQVRIAAGLMILVGTALGFFVHLYWFGLAAFVGAGLTFAGITDTCGMGMILAKMPWNQVRSKPDSSSKTTSCQVTRCC